MDVRKKGALRRQGNYENVNPPGKSLHKEALGEKVLQEEQNSLG